MKLTIITPDLEDTEPDPPATSQPLPPGRPFGSVTRFPGSCVFAEEHGVTPSHLYRVLMGERSSRKLTLAYAAWLKQRGMPWPEAAKVTPAAA